MVDEPISKPRVQSDSDRARSNRGYFGLVGIILLVVLVLMILGLRGCDTGTGSKASSGGQKSIVPVEGLTAEPGVVSAWMQQPGDLAAVLRVAGLQNSNITEMGGGRYVISVPAGTEDTVVRILANVEGVYAAGRVYAQD